MRYLTLTSDWNLGDSYIGMLKGLVLSNCQGIVPIDLSHNVPLYSIDRAAYQLRYSYSHFPKGTIHLVMVNSEALKKARFLLVPKDGHTFILPDNGMVSLLFPDLDGPVFSVEYGAEGSFSSLDCLGTILKKMDEEAPLEQFSIPTNDFETLTSLQPSWEENMIQGNIIYIDSFYNAVSNITKELFERVGKGRSYEIIVQNYYHRVVELSTAYNQVAPGDLLALFNSAQLLEVAIRNGLAAQLLSVSIGTEVKVKFASDRQPTIFT